MSSLAAQYQAVIDKYNVRNLDFDIEGADQAEPVSLERRFKAIAQIQQAGAAAGKPVRVSLTLPVLPTGLTHDGLNVVQSAIANGVDVSLVNVMAMDYYDPSLSLAPGKMGDYAVQAAESLHRQLAAFYPQKSSAQLWAMVGVTPMIGINDNPPEIFTIADAQKLYAFANQKGIGRLAMWSSNRDQPCPGPRTITENLCSGTSAVAVRILERVPAVRVVTATRGTARRAVPGKKATASRSAPYRGGACQAGPGRAASPSSARRRARNAPCPPTAA